VTLPDLSLTELEQDALTELVNIGVSRAAANLRKMVGEEVLLSVPSVEIISHRTAATVIREREGEKLVAVRQDFAGAIQGRALLIFPQANSLELVRAVLGGDPPAEELAEMEREALSETGNVILNSCLATMANMLQRSLTLSLPLVLHGDGGKLLGHAEAEVDNCLVLFLYINFSVRNRSIRGYIAMVLDLPSLEALKVLVGEFIQRVMGDDMGHAA
jgi:chemotaxis protein CheC